MSLCALLVRLDFFLNTGLSPSKTNGTRSSMCDRSVNRNELSSRISRKYFNLEIGTPALIKVVKTLISVHQAKG